MFNAKFFKDNGYLVVPKILSGELLDFVGIHAYNRARIEGVEKNPDGTIKDTQVPNTPSFYGDFVMENLHDHLLPKMEQYTGLKLYPTYTYFRVYKKDDVLEKHKDRHSCEISVSLCLRRKQEEPIWPIFIENEDYKSKRNLQNSYTARAMLEEGDGLIYRGCECAHWRDKFEGTKLAQVFLHYVDANGPNAEWKNDKKENKYFAQEK